MTKNTVIVQKWEESERGWGVRPDGYSLHLTESDRVAYEKAYWEKMPDEVQEEYSRPSGKPYSAEVDDATFAKVKAGDKGIREFDNDYPGNQGTDGWMKVEII
jgi:hypothetical protein